MRTHLALLLVVCCVASTTACNKRVFRFVEPSCDRTIPLDISIPLQRAADILIVVDSSGSMAEEQQNLADNFFNLRCDDETDFDTCECPLQNLRLIPEEFRNPAPSLYEEGGPLSQCGFIQLLAAFDNDFRVGVITTDVGPCDNRFGNLGDDFRPQRGCLQPDAPSRDGARLMISRQDLEDDDDTNDSLSARFRDTLANIGTRGTSFERGLDAMEIFLDPNSVRAPECTDDLQTFRRENAQLVTIFLTDEEDCSHADGELGFLDENDGITCGSNLPTQENTSGDRCYPTGGDTTAAGVAPVDRYAQALLRADPSAKIAVIAGLVKEGGEAVPASCLPGPTTEAPPLLDCWESRGASNQTSNGSPDPGDGLICSDDPSPTDPRTEERDGRPCCVADRGDRFVELADAIGAGSAARTSLLDSICEQSFRRTMLNIAAFLGATNVVDLVEPPAGGVIVITTVKAGESEERVVPRLNTAEECAAEDGFLLEGSRVLFCNDAVPAPGDDVFIRAKGEANTPQCAALEEAAAQ